MRARISNRKRKKIIIASVILFVITIVAIILKVNSLTRGVLNNDRIAINVKCIDAFCLSAEDINGIKSSKKYETISFSDEDANLMKATEDEICVIKLEYLVNNMESSKISDLAMELVPDKLAVGKVYACSPMELKAQEGNVMTLVQTVVADKVDVSEYFFDGELPMDFEGPYRYEVSYAMEGQYGKKTMVFAAAPKQ